MADKEEVEAAPGNEEEVTDNEEEEEEGNENGTATENKKRIPVQKEKEMTHHTHHTHHKHHTHRTHSKKEKRGLEQSMRVWYKLGHAISSVTFEVGEDADVDNLKKKIKKDWSVDIPVAAPARLKIFPAGASPELEEPMEEDALLPSDTSRDGHLIVVVPPGGIEVDPYDAETLPSEKPRVVGTNGGGLGESSGSKTLIEEMATFLSEHPLLECVLPMTLSSFCGAALAVGAPPRIIPQDETMVVALVAFAFVPLFPTLMFSVGLVGTMILTNTIFGLACSSMLLAAFTVSNGLSVAVFALYILLLSAFNFGPDRSNTFLFAEFGGSLGGLMALSYRELVQDGISVTIDDPPVNGDDFFSLLNQTLSALCVQLGEPGDCWVDGLPMLADNSTVAVTIPGDGDFSGQTAFLTLNADSSLTIAVEGGLWIVAGLWKWRGLDNSLAVMRNFIIAWSWGLVCVFVGILCPPFRTMRKTLSRGMIPSAIKHVTAHVRRLVNEFPIDGDTDAEASKEEGFEGSTVVRSYVANTGAEDTVEGDAAKDENQEVGSISREENTTVKFKKFLSDDDEEKRTLGRLVHYVTLFYGGNMAATTAYEPRLLRAPFECTWTHLKELMISIHYLIISTLAVTYVWDKSKDHRQIRAFYLTLGETDGVLDKCASALASNNFTHLLGSLEAPSEPMVFKDNINDVLTGTIGWLSAMHCPELPSPWTKEGLQNIKFTLLPWLAVPIRLLKGLGKNLLLPCYPERWDFKSFVWAAKWTVGWVALYCMSVYWEGYHNFGINTGKDGSASGLYDGWNLIAYGFTWTPTVEGTVKKGLQRCLGAALGGFAAWLGIIVASWSFDDNAEINPYGLVAWMTAMAFFNAFVSVNPGPAVRMGMSKDHGFHGIYFGLTLGICSVEVFAGNGTKGDICVNRIVTTLTGCAMAICLALLPPYYWGYDPDLARNLLAELKAALASGLHLLVSAKKDKRSELEAARESFHSSTSEQYKNATARLKDATGLRILPFFRVDPGLSKQYDELAIMASMIYAFLDRAGVLASKEDLAAEFATDTSAHKELIDIIMELEQAESVMAASTSSLGNDVPFIHPEVEMFIVFARRIVLHMENCDSTLSDMAVQVRHLPLLDWFSTLHHKESDTQADYESA